jgi:hypothetical protein
MNRNIILIIILLCVAGLAFYAWKTKKDTSTTLERADSNFKIADVNAIGRILITDKEGTRSDLKRNGDYWLINDAHRVRQTNIDNLLRGLSRLNLEHIPTQEASKNVLRNMAESGIHVQIFDRAGEKMLGYFVGGVTQDERGTYFLKEGSEQPYSLEEPGFDGGLRARYALRPKDWRDVRFWIEETEEIDTLKVHYPKQRQHSFILYKSGSNYDVKPMFSTTPLKEKVNETRVKSYLTSLTKLACENFANEWPLKDSVMQTVAFLEMDIIYPGKSSYLNFYPVVPAVEGNSTEVLRYFIDYSGKDFMVGQHDVLKNAFRSYEYFFE